MNDIIAKLYGGGPVDPDKAFPQARNPDWDAGASGDTVGGIGNTAAFGEDINWSRPDRYTASAGEVVNTPAGRYRVVETGTGFALEPLEGAVRGVQPTINNMYSGEHHFGINPETGEVWYQQAKSIPSTFSQGMLSAPQGEAQTQGMAPQAAAAQPQQQPVEEAATHNNGHPTTDPTGGPNTGPTTGVAGVSGMPSGAFTAAPLQRLNISRAAAPAMVQPQQPSTTDYVQALNQLMMRSLFRDLL